MKDIYKKVFKKGLNRKLGIGGMILGSLISTNVKAQDTLTMDVSSTLTSHYVAKGYILGKGPHRQDNVQIKKGEWSAFIWDDYDLGEKRTREIDLGIKYNLKINENISAYMKYLLMHYPQADDDNVLAVGMEHKGKLKVKFEIANFFQDREIPNGLIFFGNVSKEFKLGEKNKLELGFRTNYAHNFYKDFGLTNITPEVVFSRSGKKIDFSVFLKQQFGFIKEPKMLPPAETQFYKGITFSKRF